MTTPPSATPQELSAVPVATGEPAVSAQLSPEQVVRKFFDCYTNGRPDEFGCGRYEAAVPPADPRPGDCVGRHVRWQDVAADPNGSGPHGFVLY